MPFLFCFISLFLALPGFAQSSRQPTPEEQRQIDEYNDALAGKDPSAVTPAEPVPELATQKALRQNFFAAIEYAPLDLFVPSKIGGILGYRLTEKTMLEMEYLYSSLSVPFLFEALGGMTDQRLSVMGRSHFKKSSFNYFYGVAYHMFKIRVGNELLSRAVAHAEEYDNITINSVGFVVGLGNRWEIGDFATIGVDWVTWSQPLFETERKARFTEFVGEGDRGRINDVLEFVSDFPRFSAVKVQLGMAF